MSEWARERALRVVEELESRGLDQCFESRDIIAAALVETNRGMAKQCAILARALRKVRREFEAEAQRDGFVHCLEVVRALAEQVESHEELIEVIKKLEPEEYGHE